MAYDRIVPNPATPTAVSRLPVGFYAVLCLWELRILESKGKGEQTPPSQLVPPQHNQHLPLQTNTTVRRSGDELDSHKDNKEVDHG